MSSVTLHVYPHGGDAKDWNLVPVTDGTYLPGSDFFTVLRTHHTTSWGRLMIYLATLWPRLLNYMLCIWTWTFHERWTWVVVPLPSLAMLNKSLFYSWHCCFFVDLAVESRQQILNLYGLQSSGFDSSNSHNNFCQNTGSQFWCYGTSWRVLLSL